MEHDVIIVGGGSAGCVLAARLSEDPACKVLLLEAGAKRGGLWSRIPLGVGRILNDASRIWSVSTEPAPATDNIPRSWASGKCLGGSSAVNGLIFVRGQPSRYDDWARRIGVPDWRYDSCLPFFRKMEDWTGPASPSSDAKRGRGGPIAVSLADPEPVSDRFLAACEANGYPRLADYNATEGVGASYLQLSARNGLRCDAARGYLDPIQQRPNLTLRLGARVERVLLEGGRATGVVIRSGAERLTLRAGREVILSAGAVRSPQLLELSGIGAPAVLERAGIPVQVASPHVGEHLQDHIMVRLCFRTTLPDTVNAMLASNVRMVAEVLRFAATRRGLFSSASLKSTLYAASGESPQSPDLRIQVALVSAIDRIPKTLRGGLDPGSAFQIGVYGLYPQSAGATHVRSSDIADSPAVQPHYLAEDEDRRVLLAGLRLARRLSQTAPLKDAIVEEIRPGAALTDDAALLAYARRSGQTCWHPIGTCRMTGTDGGVDDGVVDPAGRVHGVAGLRVVDASVFPLMTASNTNAPTIMLAEKIAAAIRSGA